MRKLYFLIVFVFFILNAQSQKILFKEDFSKGIIPANWKNVAQNDSNIKWICTDQPFTGSLYHIDQAPPIASKSRGFHLQFRPGVEINTSSKYWFKKKRFPNSYIETPPIDCSSSKTVVLKFSQCFAFMDYYARKDSFGLYIALSTNGKDWKETNVTNGVNAWDESPNPMNIEMNITKLAAGQKTVYVRFIWRGLMGWYWMIDDVEVSEALDYDLQLLQLSSHKNTGNTFTKSDKLSVKIVSQSDKVINEDFTVRCILDNQTLLYMPYSAKKNPVNPLDTIIVTLPAYDLSYNGIHKVKLFTIFDKDMRKSNDTLALTLYSEAYSLGYVTNFKAEENVFTFTCNIPVVKLAFYKPNLFRIMMNYNEHFTNPAGDKIVIAKNTEKPKVIVEQKPDYYSFTTDSVILLAYKNPLRFELYNAKTKQLIWKELKSMTYGENTAQYLSRQKDEYFYGGGMQNGYFSHRDSTILIEIGGGWDNGARPNPAPFYMSTNGYGVLRNTFATGSYSFHDTLRLKHKECRFDGYFFTGSSLKQLLNEYTQLSGRPFFPPIWALELGDANCYNKNGEKTPIVISKIADEYRKNDMPAGWILPNDGYGCGYTKLDSTVVELAKRGFQTGLWTENGVEKIAKEVGDYGTRLCKLDVAWVGPGYEFGLDACKAAYEGIEKNCTSRGFIWSVCGWAGTHRYSTVWTGDQSGTWEYIRFHIPTIIGSGLSAQNCATGDIDGIFGGSAKTYTRDLQWKCFTPVLMNMSGWAKFNKQPYVHGEPYTSINRNYLKLKMRFTPYMYTYCNQAYETGVPAVRGMVLEFPNDTKTKDKTTQYQFMCGEWLLVAPVYRDTLIRDSIYLPKGLWFDYWNGKTYNGNQTLMGYDAPLDKLPLFVKGGAILPMYPEMLYISQKPKNPLTLDIYPYGNTSFTLYEDDGVTRKHRTGEFAKQSFECKGDYSDNKNVTVSILPQIGKFDGCFAKRNYFIQLHLATKPVSISLGKYKLKLFSTLADFDKNMEGCFYSEEKGGILYIKLSDKEIHKKFEIEIVKK